MARSAFTQGLYRGMDFYSDLARQEELERQAKVREDLAAKNEARQAEAFKGEQALRKIMLLRAQQEESSMSQLPGDISAIQQTARGGMLPTLAGTTVPDPMDVSDLAGQNLIALKPTQRPQTLADLSQNVDPRALMNVQKHAPYVVTAMGLKTPGEVEAQQKQQSGREEVFRILNDKTITDPTQRLSAMTAAWIKSGLPKSEDVLEVFAKAKAQRDPAAIGRVMDTFLTSLNAHQRALGDPQQAFEQALLDAVRAHPTDAEFLKDFAKQFAPKDRKLTVASTENDVIDEQGNIVRKGVPKTPEQKFLHTERGGIVGITPGREGQPANVQEIRKPGTPVVDPLVRQTQELNLKEAQDKATERSQKSQDIFQMMREGKPVSIDRARKIAQEYEVSAKEYRSAIKAASEDQQGNADILAQYRALEQDSLRSATSIRSYIENQGRPKPTAQPVAPQRVEQSGDVGANPRAGRGRTPQPASAPAAQKRFDQMPDPAQYQGKTITDTATKKKYRSNGKSWVLMGDAQ